jgi:hypothetical protein
MIYLNEDTINIVALTLTEKSTIVEVPVYYLFEFISDDTNDTKLFTAQDTSTNKNRYNRFNIEVTNGAEDLLTGVINLPTKGYYKYNVYEQTDETNLLIANTTSLVENGKVYLDGAVKPVISDYTDESKQKYVYNG